VLEDAESGRCKCGNGFVSEASGNSGIASAGPTATVPRAFVSFADAVDAKPPSKLAFWLSYTSMSTSVRAIVFTYQAVELDVTTPVNQGRVTISV
jgi:hypothetical protein